MQFGKTEQVMHMVVSLLLLSVTSYPIVQEPKEGKGKAAKAALNHLFRILIINYQSIKYKKAELHTIMNSAKPDIILGNESWLTPDIKKLGNIPDCFDAVWKDRASDVHGGVSIAFKRTCSVLKLWNWTPTAN